MYCGSCMHDNALVRALLEIGCDATLIHRAKIVAQDGLQCPGGKRWCGVVQHIKVDVQYVVAVVGSLADSSGRRDIQIVDRDVTAP